MKRCTALTKIGTITVLALAVAVCFCRAAAAADSPGSDELPAVPTSAADFIPAPGDYDGDGKTDMALKGINGVWYIDLAANGFGGLWDLVFTGYGFSSALPVPADYDHDSKTDLSIKDSNGFWGIDYAAGGFGVWDVALTGYGDAASVPVPADYDGDGKADLAVKASTGDWYINYSSDGFATGWNAHVTGYGNASAIPVPADYDGDHRADLAVKDSGGCWYIDYASNGYAGWNEIRCGYGDATAVPVPADYDNDGRADLAVKGNDGKWYVDYAANGFLGWNAIYSGRGDNSAIAVPGDYDGDGALDLSVYSTINGYWSIDYAANGFSFWDTQIDNTSRAVINTTRPYITSTTIYGDGNVAVSQMTVGVRYTVDVVIHRGSGADNAVGLEINDALNVPAALQMVHRNGSTYVADMTVGGSVTSTHRRYALTPIQPGNFPLGFQLRNAAPYSPGNFVFNPDYGIRVLCVSPPQTGLSGRVTQRIQNAQGVFVAGPAIAGATVTLVSSGGITTTTDSQGNWRFPIAATPPMSVRIAKPGFSELDIVNLTVPLSGLFVNSQMEQAFTLLPPGIKYRTYIDYSRSRILLHVVEIDPGWAAVRLGRTTFEEGACPAKGQCDVPCAPASGQCPAWDTLRHMGDLLNSLVLINATWWNICSGNPLGYVYSTFGFLDSEVWCNACVSAADCSLGNVVFEEGGGNTPLYPAGTTPMLTIVGYNGGQQFNIVESNSNFLEVPSNQWSQVGSPSHPIWDVYPRDGDSDVSYALQIGNPPLVRNGAVVAGGDFQYDSYGSYDNAFARTSVGVGSDGKFYLVIVDGEGVHGGNGATGNQLAHFYRDVLGASTAMGMDSGLSTEMLIRTPSGLYRVNTITGEDAGIQLNPYTEALSESAGAVGSVGYYLTVSGQDATAAPAPQTAVAFALQVRPSVGSTRFQFDLTLPQAGATELRLFDVRGRHVATAFQGELGPGVHTITWSGTDDRGSALAGGVYYYRLTAGRNQAKGSVVVLR